MRCVEVNLKVESEDPWALLEPEFSNYKSRLDEIIDNICEILVQAQQIPFQQIKIKYERDNIKDVKAAKCIIYMPENFYTDEEESIKLIERIVLGAISTYGPNVLQKYLKVSKVSLHNDDSIPFTPFLFKPVILSNYKRDYFGNLDETTHTKQSSLNF